MDSSARRRTISRRSTRTPGTHRGHAGLAQAYFTRWDWGCDSGTGTILKSKAEALEAIRLDPNLAEAHAWLGKALFFFDWNYSQAQEEITQAVDLNPSYEHAHSMLAVLSVAPGRPEQGLAEMKRALELDPTSEISNVVATYLFYLTRQYDRAIEQGKRTIELYPNSPAPYVWLGATYEQKRMYAEAGDAYLTEKTLRGVPATSVQASRNAYQLSGIHGYWERELASAKAAHGHACWIATIESHLGDKQEALESLAPALQQHCSGLHALSVDPVFDPLRGDPRFTEIEARQPQ